MMVLYFQELRPIVNNKHYIKLISIIHIFPNFSCTFEKISSTSSLDYTYKRLGDYWLPYT